MTDLVRLIVDMVQRVHALEHRVSSQIRQGTISDVDNTKHRVRVMLDEPGAEPFKSGWMPAAQFAAPGKGLKAHTPMTVGQSVTIFAPAGELRQAVAVPFTWSDQAPAPGSDDHPVLTFGDWNIDAKGDEITVTTPKLKIISGDTVIAIEDGKITLTGDLVQVSGTTLKHNTKSIGDTHRHTGVVPGGGNSSIPL
jgi:phage baseplate assembly protein V